MGIKKKMTAWFLVLVMVCSMFVGVPVSATEGDAGGQEESVTGFVMSTGFQWDDNGVIVGVDNLNRNEEWANNANWIPFAFGNYTDENVMEAVSWEDIQIEVNTGTKEEPKYEKTEDIVYRDFSNFSESVSDIGVSIYELKFPEAEFGQTVEYRFSCKNGNEGEYVSFYYEAKPFGFYKNADDDGTNYLNTIYYSGDETTFYLLPHTDDDNCTLSVGETPFEGKVWDTEGRESALDVETYFTITGYDDENEDTTFDGYVITLNNDAFDGETIELKFYGDRTWYDENGNMTDNNTWEEYITVSPSLDNSFLLVHDENCEMGTDLQPVRYDEEGNLVGETRYLVDCEFDQHGDRYIETYYQASDIKIYKKEFRWDEDSQQDVEERREMNDVVEDVTDSNGNNSLYFTFEEEGDYVISMGEDVERVISVYANAYNEFYLSTEETAEPIWEFSTTGSEEDRTLYFIVKDLDGKNLGGISFDAYVEGEKIEDDQEESYFTYDDISDEEDATKKIYKIDITATQGFEIVTEAQLFDETYTWNKTNSIWINYVETGLMFGDPKWGNNGLTGELWDGSYAKYMEGEIRSVRWVYLGVTEDGENYTAVDPSAFEEDTENPDAQLKINRATDYIIASSDVGPFSAEKDTVVIKEELAAKGIYGFYMRDNINITYGGETITINKNLPTIGFYKANEANFDNFISNDYFMSETEMFEGMPIYVLPRSDVKNYSYTLDTIDKTILINDEAFVYTHSSDDEHPAGYYQSASSFTTPIKISVEKCAGSFLRLRGEINWEEGEPEPFEQYLGLMYENKDAIILEDNSPHEGFGGCLISESDYKVSQWWQMSGDVYYWVHGKTIQEVVDQLSAVAEAGEVTVDGKTYPIGMTDYIWLNTSYFKYSEDFANSTQHVVTPSNIKGIIMQAEAEAPYALFNNGGKKGYYQVREWTDGNNILLLTQVPNDSNYYPVEKLSQEEAIAQKADYVVSSYDDVWTTQSLADAGYEPIVDEFNNATNVYPVFLPNLYVDATVEVKMIGNFGNEGAGKKVQLGFYEGSTNKSIINGKEFSAKDIGKEEIVKSAMVGSDEENIVTVTVTEFKASTECSKAPINGESCEVTLDGENASLRDKIDIYQKGDDDYADAKELAEGKPLKVKLDVNEAKEDDAEAKKVKEQVEKDCSKDKTKPSKVQYLDIDMKYQVGDRDPKAVTETMEEVDITMDIPDSFQQTGKHAKKRKYKVYRYHNGKVDMLEADFDKDKKKLHFKTDKFSTYALVAEDVAPVSIEVSANPTKLSYVEGELFDKTGMTISLVYSDGTKEALTDYVVSTTNALTLTDTSVTITYDTFTATIPITVLEKPATSNPDDDTSQNVLPEVGKTVTTANGSCKVTAIGLEGAVEVTFTPSKANKKAKKAKIDKTVTIDGKEYAVTTIAAGAFSGNTKMTSISIPDTVTKIGNNAFKGCTNLKKVTIPKNVTEIGNNAFYNCKKITGVTIKGSSLVKIGTGTFRKCSSLKSVTIPKNVTEIGKDAFRDCTKLNKVTIKGTKIKKIGKNAFKNIAKKSTIKVPKSKKKAYKTLLKKAGYTKTVK